jgi:polysaccharide export outer membrane protein
MGRRILFTILCTSAVARAQALPGGEAPAAAAASAIGEAVGNVEHPPLEGPVDPARYLLGPGDHLLVELWGLRDSTTDLEVGPEGRLVIPKVGSFPAGGRSLATLRAEVEQRIKAAYPSLHGAVTLARPRTFLVHVVGAVLRPGAYRATPVTRVSDLVTRAGGPLPRASTRAVEVRRGPATIVADLARFLLLGQGDADPTVLDGDTLFVPLRQIEVEISGAVKRPGRYELIAGRDVAELLELAGGVAADAARALPVRVSARGGADTVAVRSVAQDRAPATALHDGDRVHVPSLADLRRTVVVEGAIVGLPASATDGIAPAADRNNELGLQRAPFINDKRADTEVSLPREVSIPLAFVEGDGVRDLINKVGGLQPWADAASAYLLRRAPKGDRRRIPVDVPAIAEGRSPEVPVEPGDTLVVPSRRESVIVGGAVMRPGLYQYTPGLHPSDYLTLAGGATRTGDVRAARVLGHNGASRRLSKVTSIEPGDTISVPEKKVTAGEWIEITLILGNLAVATTALVLAQTR